MSDILTVGDRIRAKWTGYCGTIRNQRTQYTGGSYPVVCYDVQWDVDSGVTTYDFATFEEPFTVWEKITHTPDIASPQGCTHEWVQYDGLFESYKFCKKCDHKDL